MVTKIVYTAGWNLPGCLPEVPPVEFDTEAEAQQYVDEARAFGAECYGTSESDPYAYWTEMSVVPVGCVLCRVGTEDDCTDDCPSRMRSDSEWNDALVDAALAFATTAHAGQRRWLDDEPYINHCTRVAAIVKRAGASPWVVAAALLHDTVEDTDTTLEDIESMFGEEVAALVSLLTKGPDMTYEQYLNRLIPDPNAWLVKRSDLLDNMSTLPSDHRLMRKYVTALDILVRGDVCSHPCPHPSCGSGTSTNG